MWFGFNHLRIGSGVQQVNELPDPRKDIFLTSWMTFIYSSRTLLDAFRCTFADPTASAVVTFVWRQTVQKNGQYIVCMYLSQNEVHWIFSSVRLHPPAYSCCDYTLNKRVRGEVDIARHSGSFNLRNVYTPPWSFRAQRPKIETLRLILCNSACLCVYVRECVCVCVGGGGGGEDLEGHYHYLWLHESF